MHKYTKIWGKTICTFMWYQRDCLLTFPLSTIFWIEIKIKCFSKIFPSSYQNCGVHWDINRESARCLTHQYYYIFSTAQNDQIIRDENGEVGFHHQRRIGE